MNDDNGLHKEISRPSFLSLRRTNPNDISLSREGRIQNPLSAICKEVNRDQLPEARMIHYFEALRYWIILHLLVLTRIMRGAFEEEEEHDIFKPDIETKERVISNWKLLCGHKEEISLADRLWK